LYDREGKVDLSYTEIEPGNACDGAGIGNIWKEEYALEYVSRIVE
jgi:hypothetical protein